MASCQPNHALPDPSSSLLVQLYVGQVKVRCVAAESAYLIATVL